MTENLVQDQVGHTIYGKFSAILALCVFAGLLADFGVNQFTAKIIAAYPERFPQYFSNTITLKLISSFISTLILIAVGWQLGYQQEWFELLGIAALSQVMQNFFTWFRAIFQGLQQFGADAVASILDKTLLMILVWVLLYQGIEIHEFSWATLISGFLASLICLLMVIRLQGWYGVRFELSVLRTIIQGGIPFGLMAALYGLNDKVAPLLVEQLHSAKEAGLFAAAFRWINAISMYLWTVLPIFYANFAKYSTRNIEKTQSIFNAGQIIVALPIIFVTGFVFCYAEKLFWLFGKSTAEEISRMATALRWLMISVWFNGIFNIYSTYLTATGHEKLVNQALVVTLISFICLNWLFTPLWGANAAALSLSLSVVLLSVAYLWNIERLTPIRIQWKQLGQLVGLTILHLICFYGL
ncbi:MAG: polysaccharide biosynthesis C-terminal domain-containing protein, partial [Bacteroidia bacterium]|nr:polysaccharide biosynthesis C-terminal domain-containing protein [Bacteroidia bacterium]